MFSNWFHNGIKVFKDIYDEASKKVYPYGSLRETYNLPEVDFLKYLTLIHSISHSWKNNVKNENTNTPNLHTTLNKLMNTKYPNKYLNNLLLERTVLYFKRIILSNRLLFKFSCRNALTCVCSLIQSLSAQEKGVILFSFDHLSFLF